MLDKELKESEMLTYKLSSSWYKIFVSHPYIIELLKKYQFDKIFGTNYINSLKHRSPLEKSFIDKKLQYIYDKIVSDSLQFPDFLKFIYEKVGMDKYIDFKSKELRVKDDQSDIIKDYFTLNIIDELNYDNKGCSLYDFFSVGQNFQTVQSLD